MRAWQILSKTYSTFSSYLLLTRDKFQSSWSKTVQDQNSSVKVTTPPPPVDLITSQTHQLPDESLVKSVQIVVSCEREEEFKVREERIRVKGPLDIKRKLDLAAAKGSSVRVTVLSLLEMGSNLIKGEFRKAVKLR